MVSGVCALLVHVGLLGNVWCWCSLGTGACRALMQRSAIFLWRVPRSARVSAATDLSDDVLGLGRRSD